MKREKGDTVQDLINHMLGTCESIDLSEWTQEELQEFDEALFECACCGWWCENGDWATDYTIEKYGGDVCSDCNEHCQECAKEFSECEC